MLYIQNPIKNVLAYSSTLPPSPHPPQKIPIIIMDPSSLLPDMTNHNRFLLGEPGKRKNSGVSWQKEMM